MIKYILATTKQIMEGTLPYQTFTKELGVSSFNDGERLSIRQLVNALLNRYYRYYYSLTQNETTSLTTEDVLALALYSFNVEKNVSTFTYDEILATLPVERQVKLETDYPAHSFPIKIPAGIHKEDLALSFAARFSLPLFVVEQLLKDIGKKNILRFLSKRPSENCGLINHNLIEPAAFFAKYPSFKVGKREDSFTYEGKDYIKKTTAYIDNEVILTTQSLLDVAELVGELAPKSMLFMQYEDTSLLLLLALLFPELEIHYSAVEPKSRFILQHLSRKFGLKNVHYMSNITTTYDLVLTTLSGSNLNGNIRHRDFYFRLAPNLEEYATNAASELVGVKDYVNETGSLIFLSATALRSETHYQALSFIRDYPEFTLEREKQYFHFNEQQETIYYALFKKGGNVEAA